jgi:hypothetical protein
VGSEHVANPCPERQSDRDQGRRSRLSSSYSLEGCHQTISVTNDANYQGNPLCSINPTSPEIELLQNYIEATNADNYQQNLLDSTNSTNP